MPKRIEDICLFANVYKNVASWMIHNNVENLQKWTPIHECMSKMEKNTTAYKGQWMQNVACCPKR